MLERPSALNSSCERYLGSEAEQPISGSGDELVMNGWTRQYVRRSGDLTEVLTFKSIFSPQSKMDVKKVKKWGEN